MWRFSYQTIRLCGVSTASSSYHLSFVVCSVVNPCRRKQPPLRRLDTALVVPSDSDSHHKSRRAGSENINTSTSGVKKMANDACCAPCTLKGFDAAHGVTLSNLYFTRPTGSTGLTPSDARISNWKVSLPHPRLLLSDGELLSGRIYTPASGC